MRSSRAGTSHRPGDSEEEGLDLSERCWRDAVDEMWMTDFPPPAGFTGYESRPYDDTGDDERYVRACTDEEIAALEADAAAERAAERAEEEALRDAWFAMLRAEQTSNRHAELVSASIAGTGDETEEIPDTAEFMDPDLRQDDG
jgi:hypothetical protein